MSNEATASKRGLYARSHKRREQIALAVLELVDEAGHASVTTALVAQRSHTPEPTVLYHFPTKDHLLVAALERADDIAVLSADGESDEVRLDLEALRRAADSALRENERRVRLYVVLMGQAATPSHPAAEYFTRRTERGVAIFTRLVARRQQEGLAHPGLDPAQVARQIVALWDGLTLMWVNDRTLEVGWLLRDAVRRLSGENWMAARELLNRDDVGL
ncbi:TetR/AcrR family transcriptional regulator [Streptomyces sp. UG1]|uniref:TetR/AcrR family transcriptional regulator n=1 Tax=Streptomyces sp. UG1 TaxID=3417652 RepID=UPI003CE9C11A